MASQSEELRKKRFELNRLVDPNWAGGKYGAPGIGGEEVLYSLIPALAPAGILGASRAASAGVRGFNTAAQKLDPLAEGISGFVTSPVGQQYLGNLSKTLLFNKLAKEIDRRYGIASQPWFRRDEKEHKKREIEYAARDKRWEEERAKILGDFIESMPYHREKSQKVVNIGMGDTIRDVRRRGVEDRQQSDWAIRMLEQLKLQGASKLEIDEFIQNSGIVIDPDPDSARNKRQISVDLGLRSELPPIFSQKDIEQYYPNPEGAQVKALPLEHSIINAVRTLRRERGDETVVPGLAEKDSQELFKTDPKKWLWSLSSEEVYNGPIDPKMLTKALETQGIEPFKFKRYHYLGFDDPEAESYDIEGRGTIDRSSIGMRSKWYEEVTALIEAKNTGKYDNDPLVLKTLNKGIKAGKEIIKKFDSHFDYDMDKFIAEVKGNLTKEETKTMNKLKGILEERRSPSQRKEYLKLKSKARWGKDYTFLDNFWNND